jgi:hypothetical protein
MTHARVITSEKLTASKKSPIRNCAAFIAISRRLALRARPGLADKTAQRRRQR